MTTRDKVSFHDMLIQFGNEMFAECNHQCDNCAYAVKYDSECPFVCPMDFVEKMIRDNIAGNVPPLFSSRNTE